MSSSCVFDF